MSKYRSLRTLMLIILAHLLEHKQVNLRQAENTEGNNSKGGKFKNASSYKFTSDNIFSLSDTF